MIAWMRSASPIILFFIAIFILTGCQEHASGILNPKGLIAYEERKLFFDTLALMLIVVLPVIIMSLAFVYHYQASHKIKDYKPNWGHSYFLECIWWGVPCVIVFILGIITWKSTHLLDPYQKITGHAEKPLIIQAISLPWKWLFIYPEQGIATVNYLEIPVGQPVEFWITADNAAMTALFIPQLGSQIYAMAGMRTRLNLLANEVGVYKGLNTQYNGAGFSDMSFNTYVVSTSEMASWVEKARHVTGALTDETYRELLKPSIKNPPAFYTAKNSHLFDQVIALYQDTFGTKHPRADY